MSRFGYSIALLAVTVAILLFSISSGSLVEQALWIGLALISALWSLEDSFRFAQLLRHSSVRENLDTTQEAAIEVWERLLFDCYKRLAPLAIVGSISIFWGVPLEFLYIWLSWLALAPLFYLAYGATARAEVFMIPALAVLLTSLSDRYWMVPMVATLTWAWVYRNVGQQFASYEPLWRRYLRNPWWFKLDLQGHLPSNYSLIGLALLSLAGLSLGIWVRSIGLWLCLLSLFCCLWVFEGYQTGRSRVIKERLEATWNSLESLQEQSSSLGLGITMPYLLAQLPILVASLILVGWIVGEHWPEAIAWQLRSMMLLATTWVVACGFLSLGFAEEAGVESFETNWSFGRFSDFSWLVAWSMILSCWFIPPQILWLVPVVTFLFCGWCFVSLMESMHLVWSPSLGHRSTIAASLYDLFSYSAPKQHLSSVLKTWKLESIQEHINLEELGETQPSEMNIQELMQRANENRL